MFISARPSLISTPLRGPCCGYFNAAESHGSLTDLRRYFYFVEKPQLRFCWGVLYVGPSAVATTQAIATIALIYSPYYFLSSR